MMEKEKGFKVFKINSNTFYIGSFFYLPNSKFKDYIYICEYMHFEVKKLPMKI